MLCAHFSCLPPPSLKSSKNSVFSAPLPRGGGLRRLSLVLLVLGGLVLAGPEPGAAQTPQTVPPGWQYIPKDSQGTPVFTEGQRFQLLFSPPVEGQESGLFSAVNQPPPAGPFADATLRSRLVTIDFAQLQRAPAVAASPPPVGVSPSSGWQAAPSVTGSAPWPGTRLTFNLFADVVVTGVVERTAPTFSGGYALSGRLVGEPLGSLTLVVNGKTVAGTVRTPAGTYHLRSVGAGRYAISEVAEPEFADGCEALAPPLEAPDRGDRPHRH